MSDEDDIVLAELSDDDLVLQMHDDLYDGLKEEIEEGTQILLDRGWSAEKVLSTALVDGMTIVGIDFRDADGHGRIALRPDTQSGLARGVNDPMAEGAKACG